MSGKLKIVLVNGAIGVGKSWLCQQLNQRMPGSTVKIGLNDGLKEVMCKITGYDLFDEEVYSWFKSKLFDNGKTGREWMIHISESSKEYHPTVWVDRFIDRCAQHGRGRLVLCDSFGFPIEFHALLAKENVETINVYIDDSEDIRLPKLTLEGEYRQFPGDSRFDLSRHCSIRAMNSNYALPKVLESLRNRGW